MSIKALIIEDEPLAADKLKRTLHKIDPNIHVHQICQSIVESVETLSKETFDLVFSDIHLSDGLSFLIFKEVKIDTPIIFTTAYDQYAIEAFKTNSIDYLLKPVRRQALETALKKYSRLNPTSRPEVNYERLLSVLQKDQTTYKERFLVQSGESELKTVNLEEIAYFFAEGKYTFIVCKNGKQYLSDTNIVGLVDVLDPKFFFQINRKFFVHISSIAQIVRYSKSRLKINLNPPSNIETLISAERSTEFKAWLGK